MKAKFAQIIFFLFLCIPLASVFALNSDTTKPHINYCQTELNIRPPATYTQQPKQQVFPLSWNTGTLDKVNSGTGVWTELNPKVPRVDYLGIHFVNPDTGWTVGASGALIKTTDSGENWLQIYSGSGFNNLFILDSLNGWIVIYYKIKTLGTYI